MYSRTPDTDKNLDLLINSIKNHQKYQYQSYIDKLEKLDKISSNSKTKYIPIDWLVWYDHFQMEIRESNFFHSHTVVTAYYMREIGKIDHKLLIQLSQENNWHLLSDDVHKISHVFKPYTKNQKLEIFTYSGINSLAVRNPF